MTASYPKHIIIFFSWSMKNYFKGIFAEKLLPLCYNFALLHCCFLSSTNIYIYQMMCLFVSTVFFLY